MFTVPDDAEIPAERLRYAPGQFLTLRVPSDRTGSVARCYSLCSSPFTDEAMTVTVKRDSDGYASNWLCDHAHPGMRIHVLAPSGTFVPKTLDDDFLLLAAGSGITPIMSICKSALSEGGGQVVLIYANRDERSVIFGDALRELAAKYPDRLTVVHWLESLQGLPSATALAQLAAPFTDRQAFICGPGPFMAAAREALEALKVPAPQVHIEVFKSLETDPFAAVESIDDDDGDEPPATAVVELDGQTHTVLVAAQGQAARRAAGRRPGRAVLLPRGPLRRLRHHPAQRQGEHGGQRCARAAGPRRRADPGLPVAPGDRFGRSHLRRVAAA